MDERGSGGGSGGGTFKLLLGELGAAAGVVEVVGDADDAGTAGDLQESSARHRRCCWVCGIAVLGTGDLV